MNSSSRETPRISFYTRAPQADGPQELSLEAQERALRGHCRSVHGDAWLHHRTYRDESEGVALSHQTMRAMFAEVDGRAFELLMVTHLDRLTRNAEHLRSILYRLTTRDIGLLSLSEPFDTSVAAGQVAARIDGALVKASRRPATRPMACYGYAEQCDGALAIVPHEAEIVRQVYELYVRRRLGTTLIARILNERGLRTRRGIPWGSATIAFMLRNPTYVRPQLDSEALAGRPREPIISEEEARLAAQIRAERAQKLAPKVPCGAVDRCMLTGIVWCGVCGSRFIAVRGPRADDPFHYGCVRRCRRHTCSQETVSSTIETELVRWVALLLTCPTFMNRVRTEACRLLGRESPVLEREFKSCCSRLRKAQASLEATYRSFEAGRTRIDRCRRQAERLSGQQAQLEAERSRLREEFCRTSLPPVEMAMLEAAVAQFRVALVEGTNLRRKLWMRQFVPRLEVGPSSTATIWLRLPKPGQLREPLRHLPDRNPKGEHEVFMRVRCEFIEGVLRPAEGTAAVSAGPPGDPAEVFREGIPLPRREKLGVKSTAGRAGT